MWLSLGIAKIREIIANIRFCAIMGPEGDVYGKDRTF
jgi:hypothetical protein